jgi:aryl-alcohol dehydrogenase-like predicted oxidoreductase
LGDVLGSRRKNIVLVTKFGRPRLLDIAMSWIASRPLVASVIAGATKPEQVEANVKAASFVLTAEDLAELDKLTA